MRLCVIGDPVAHSLSPAIHRAALRAAGIAGEYEALRIPAGTLRERLDGLRARYLGCNVTTPLKEEAAALCARLDDFARAVGAANTLRFDAEGTAGWNTDGEGAAVAAARAAGTSSVEGVSVAVLGTGPAARAAALGIAQRGGRVAVWGRREEGVRGVLALVAGARPWGFESIDVVFSTLPPGVELPPLLAGALVAAPAVVDANYGPRADLGARLGRPVADGLTMLVAQAAASFRLWLGIEPDVTAMERAAKLEAADRSA
ncbi:MAG TPA: shikimate dehydrogenase [Candidatus Dormibacteraeota bacterium]|nr:shikimate dehydrogenase [Candidatus Dormibacteraeota bacterium]